jgi:hypothetical protein
MTRLDHLVIAAPTLDAGEAWVHSELGVGLRPGGDHPRMGTHNRLLRLGGDVYLEVIAADPTAASPSRPRWFGLDRLVPNSPPRVVAWVARTDDLEAAVAASPEPVGSIEAMSRGDLRWYLTVPSDRSTPFDGAGPLLIRWDASPHPAARLPDDRCELVRLKIGHPDPERVARLMDALAFDGPVSVEQDISARLTAEIRTPAGVRRI